MRAATPPSPYDLSLTPTAKFSKIGRGFDTFDKLRAGTVSPAWTECSRTRGQFQQRFLGHGAEEGERKDKERGKTNYAFAAVYSAGNPFTIFTISTLTQTTWPTRRTMYCSSSGLLG
jgi:hypothetical protein